MYKINMPKYISCYTTTILQLHLVGIALFGECSFHPNILVDQEAVPTERFYTGRVVLITLHGHQFSLKQPIRGACVACKLKRTGKRSSAEANSMENGA